MAQTSSLVDEESKKLIENVTGFTDSNNENFRRSLQFVLSNFKFHRYLDVDSHKINKKLRGLLQKFEIHSQLEKAKLLQQLTDKFLQLPLCEKIQEPKTDTHYSILSVLLNLSDNPVNTDYAETLQTTKQDEEDDFDWGKYLQEGLAPIPDFRGSSSDEWSDEEILDDSAIQADQSQHSPASVQHPIGHDITSHPTRDQEFGMEHHGSSWIERNVVVQYWEGKRDRHVRTLHSSATVADTWRTYEELQNQLPAGDETYTVTEAHIIRETIWLLMGAETSFVYQTQDGKLTPRTDIQVSHLTPRALHKSTSRLAEICTHVRQLQSFVDSVRTAPMAYIRIKDSSEEGDRFKSQTYESFAEGVSVILWEFRQELTALEKEVMKQETSITLSRFAINLEPWADKILVLSQVHDAGIAASKVENTGQRTWLLLSVLQGTMEAEYQQGMHKEEKVLMLLRLWMVTIRPYIQFLDNWLSSYPLYDPAQEFVIQRNPEITVRSPDFWEKAFTLHLFTSPNKNGINQPQQNGQHLGPNQKQQDGGVHAIQFEGVAVPVFLQPVLKDILLAGKCMEVLESMGKLSAVWRKYHPEKSSVYDEFSTTIKKLLHSSEADRITTVQQTYRKLSDSSSIAPLKELQDLGIKDPLMAHNFSQLFSELEYFSLEKNDADKSWSSLLVFEFPLVSNMKPLTLILHRCLYPLLTAKSSLICRELVTVLRKDYNLMDTFASMRKFYLCEAGDTMFEFLSDLFDKLRSSHQDSQWQDALYLNYQLQIAIGSRFPSDADRLTVSFEPVSAPSIVSVQPIHALDGLTLHYKVPWPLDIIINAENIGIYNQVFRFLLQVKRAKYCLEQLRFISISRSASPHKTEAEMRQGTEHSPLPSPHSATPPSKAKLLHRVYLLRFRLVHFVNAVHSYLMSRILHSTGLEFESDMEKATDLQTVLQIHASYLGKVSERCLLHRKVSLVREAVTKALNLAVVFQRRWDTGLAAFSSESIEKMLSEFNKCTTFLLTMLNNINKRGAFPHLEALALSLTQSHEEESSIRPEVSQQK